MKRISRSSRSSRCGTLLIAAVLMLAGCDLGTYSTRQAESAQTYEAPKMEKMAADADKEMKDKEASMEK